MATEKATQEQEQTSSTLDDFKWDDNSSDFFGIKGSGEDRTEMENVLEVVKIEKDDEEEGFKKTSKKLDDNEDEDEEEVWFGNSSTEEEEEEEEDKDNFMPNSTKTTKASENIYADLYAEIKEGGLFQTDLEEGTVVDKEKFFELQELEIEARVEESIKGFMEELDEEGAAFLKFKKNGGSTAEFLKVYAANTEVPQGDLDDEVHQEKVSRYYYKNVEGLDPEDVDDRIEWLKTSGKLEKYAIKIDADLKEKEAKEKEALQTKAKLDAKEAEQKRKDFINTVQETLDNTDEIDGYKFNPAEKKALHSFITKPSIKVGQNMYVTPFQQKLRTALADKEKMLVLAKLLSNDFDVSDVVAAKTTAQTKKIKEDLQRKKGPELKSSGKPEGKKRGLADFF
jgi:hypothetical protein